MIKALPIISNAAISSRSISHFLCNQNTTRVGCINNLIQTLIITLLIGFGGSFIVSLLLGQPVAFMLSNYTIPVHFVFLLGFSLFPSVAQKFYQSFLFTLVASVSMKFSHDSLLSGIQLGKELNLPFFSIAVVGWINANGASLMTGLLSRLHGVNPIQNHSSISISSFFNIVIAFVYVNDVVFEFCNQKSTGMSLLFVLANTSTELSRFLLKRKKRTEKKD
ncbi:hypothetical protein P9112_007853 [Eukaryota sp. TZLM1-RC]